MAMFDSWQLTRIWFCIFGRFCLSDAFVLPELPFVSVKPQCLIASTCRSRHTFKAFLMCWDPLFTCILYSYGPFPVISTYNPIYRMYNPIYNQLQLINGHNCTYPGIPSLWFFQISPVSQFIMGTTSFIPGWEWYIVQSCLSPKISSLVEGNMNTGSFHEHLMAKHHGLRFGFSQKRSNNIGNLPFFAGDILIPYIYIL